MAPKKQALKTSGASKTEKSQMGASQSARKSGGTKSWTAIQLSPVRGRVVIRQDEGETRTSGGLYIPDSAQDKPLTGRVMAIGSGTISKKGRLRPMDVKTGDRVLFGRYTGSQIDLNGDRLLVVEEAEILGIIQN